MTQHQSNKAIQVRPLKKEKIPLIVSYFFSATPEFSRGKGANPNKLPNKLEWTQTIKNQIYLPLEEKSYSTYFGFIIINPLGIPTLPL